MAGCRFSRASRLPPGVEFKREQVASGVALLDQLLGGGVERGTSTLLIGPPGSGKSTIALQYAGAAARAR